jgi:hypothetical protein
LPHYLAQPAGDTRARGHVTIDRGNRQHLELGTCQSERGGDQIVDILGNIRVDYDFLGGGQVYAQTD